MAQNGAGRPNKQESALEATHKASKVILDKEKAERTKKIEDLKALRLQHSPAKSKRKLKK